MVSIVILIGLPILGWCLIKMARNFDQVVRIAHEIDVDFEFLKIQGTTNTLLLMSDVRFMKWLVYRRYRTKDYPKELLESLERARRSYLHMGIVFVAIFFVAFVYGQVAT